MEYYIHSCNYAIMFKNLMQYQPNFADPDIELVKL